MCGVCGCMTYLCERLALVVGAHLVVEARGPDVLLDEVVVLAHGHGAAHGGLARGAHRVHLQPLLDALPSMAQGERGRALAKGLWLRGHGDQGWCCVWL